MDVALITTDGVRHERNQPFKENQVQQLLAAGTPFWLDLQGTGQETADVLRDVFQFHPLAVEDAEHFGQRPKVDDYDGYVLFVLYGAPTSPGEPLVELHCFYSEHYLVTVHQDACPSLLSFAERVAQTRRHGQPLIMLLHGVLDTLVDSFFPVLAAFDDEIDDLEDAILEQPTDDQLGRLFEMKRSLIAVRKVVTPARDTLATVISQPERLPGSTPESERYFRDVYDHLIRISDLVDSYRDLLSSVLDTHLSTVSNRLNVIMKQLTLIATLFLPLSFLTGFFGQNFDVLVAHIASLSAFLIYGIGLELLAAIGLLTWFWRRGWLTSEGTPRTQTARRRGRAQRRLRLAHLHR